MHANSGGCDLWGVGGWRVAVATVGAGEGIQAPLEGSDGVVACRLIGEPGNDRRVHTIPPKCQHRISDYTHRATTEQVTARKTLTTTGPGFREWTPLGGQRRAGAAQADALTKLPRPRIGSRSPAGGASRVTDVLIDNPILNSPYEEPARHSRFSDEGFTDDVVQGRGRSGYFVPAHAAPTRQLQLETHWTGDPFESRSDINEVRDLVARWRATNYDGVASTTWELLEYWSRADRERPLFFAQQEAIETAILPTEAAGNEFGGTHLRNKLRDWPEEQDPGLLRAAFKMATRTKRSTMIRMLHAWRTLSKAARPAESSVPFGVEGRGLVRFVARRWPACSSSPAADRTRGE